MAKCELSIKDTYVKDWGVWECVRESMQNGLDEDDRGHPLTVTYENGVLKIHNDGADLKVQALVLGVGDKAEQEGMRGKHCEGLALGLLAGVRNGIPIKIRTQSENWTASIEHSVTWQTTVLVVRTRKMKTHSGVTVSIPIDEELWTDYKKRFLKFSVVRSITTECGNLLVDDEHVGMLFDKGIFIEKKKDLKYGYDFKYANLDRDRKFISDFNFKWESSRILESATLSSSEFIKDLMQVIQEDGPESRAFLLKNPGFEVKEKLAEEFKKSYGPRAVPVTDVDSSKKASALGRCGVVVPKAMKECLIGTSVQTLADVQDELKNEVRYRYSWKDFDEKEQTVFNETMELHTALVEMFEDNENLCGELHISSVISKLKNFPLKVVVVEFCDEGTRGQWSSKNQECLISRREMTHTFRFLRVVLHEHTHAVSGGDDTTLRQTYTEAEILTALAYVCEHRRK